MDSISCRQIGLSVGKDFAVELTFPSGKVGACSILVDHGYEGSIPRTASAIGSRYLRLVDHVRFVRNRQRHWY